MPLYSATTLTQALAELAQRLYDAHPTASPFWTDAEKTIYIQEALRAWNAMTSFWRVQFVFNTVNGQTWYDLADTTSVANTPRPMSYTDVGVVTEMEYHLLEPPTGKTWTGSLQFNINDLLQAIARRRDEIVSLSGCTLKQSLVPANAGMTILNDKTIDIRRVAWLPVAGIGYINSSLWPDDTWALQSYERDYTISPPGIPSTYQQSTEPPLSFLTDIDPAVPGNYDVLTVEAGTDLSVIITSILNVPNDWVWVVKYGALADLMGRDSVSRDSLRQKYCQMRYQQGLSMLLTSPAVLSARLNNLPLDVEALQSADDYRPGWQAEANSQPNTLLIGGLNIIGMAPTPDAAYALTLNVVQNAPIPAVGTDLIQISRDDYDVILDYAQHIASFKMGGAEFLATFPLLQRFYTQCQMYNSKLAQLGEFQKAIYELSQLQQQFNPTYQSASPADQGAS
ncbi:MAG: hypothetical protein ACREJN_21320 [Nitrospiraceae bacterium]